jgi:molecular chaperone DnaJ
MTQRDYYEVLNVTKSSSNDEIKTSYRKLAMQYHPDRNPGDPTAEEKFKEAAVAYEVLSDPDKRARYDRFGHKGVQGGQDFHNYSNINDIFSAFGDIFGGGFSDLFGQQRGRRQRGEDGADLRVRLPITLEEIATGVDKTIKIKHYKTCGTCAGAGAPSASDYATCTACNGTGEFRQVSRSVFGQFVNIAPCSACSGTGELLKNHCPDCQGEGRVQGESSVKVTVPPGVNTGNYLTITGKGHAGRRGGSAGDAQIVMEEQPHAVFERENDDVYMNATVDFPTAALGSEIEVQTLYGKENVKIEPGTQPGSLIRLKGKGIPHLNSRGKGDQFIRFNVYVPNSLSSKEKSIVASLKDSENFKPSAPKKGARQFFDKVKEALT